MQNYFHKEYFQKVLFKDNKGYILESFFNSQNLKNTKAIFNKTALHQKLYRTELSIDTLVLAGESGKRSNMSSLLIDQTISRKSPKKKFTCLFLHQLYFPSGWMRPTKPQQPGKLHAEYGRASQEGDVDLYLVITWASMIQRIR